MALLLSKLEFIIVPVANPDGYEVSGHVYNHFTDTVHVQLTWTDYPRYRFWRKNVSHKEGSSCLGVDLNRNFDVKWSQVS